MNRIKRKITVQRFAQSIVLKILYFHKHEKKGNNQKYR